MDVTKGNSIPVQIGVFKQSFFLESKVKISTCYVTYQEPLRMSLKYAFNFCTVLIYMYHRAQVTWSYRFLRKTLSLWTVQSASTVRYAGDCDNSTIPHWKYLRAARIGNAPQTLKSKRWCL